MSYPPAAYHAPAAGVFVGFPGYFETPPHGGQPWAQPSPWDRPTEAHGIALGAAAGVGYGYGVGSHVAFGTPAMWQPQPSPGHGPALVAQRTTPAATAARGNSGASLAFPGGDENSERERRRQKQQEMQAVLAAQVEEQRARKLQEQRLRKEEDARDEARLRQEADAGAGFRAPGHREGNVGGKSTASPLAGAQSRGGQHGPQPVAGYSPSQAAFTPHPQAQPSSFSPGQGGGFGRPPVAQLPQQYQQQQQQQPSHIVGGYAPPAAGLPVAGGGLDPQECEKERRRLQQERFQHELAQQVEEARQRKKEEERRRAEEDAREEARFQREIAEEACRVAEIESKRSQQAANLAGNPKNNFGEDSKLDLRKTREKMREPRSDKMRESRTDLRKTGDRMRSKRGNRRPRTQDHTSPKHERRSLNDGAQSPAVMSPSPEPGFALGSLVATSVATNTAGTWWRSSASPDPSGVAGHSMFGAAVANVGRPPDISLGFHGFVEQQMQLASEMQRQVDELRRQRDEAREQALRAREEAINGRALALQEMQQSILQQLGVGRSSAPSPAPSMMPVSPSPSPPPPGKSCGAGRAAMPEAVPQSPWEAVPPMVVLGGRGYTNAPTEALNFCERSMTSDSRLVPLDASPFSGPDASNEERPHHARGGKEAAELAAVGRPRPCALGCSASLDAQSCLVTDGASLGASVSLGAKSRLIEEQASVASGSRGSKPSATPCVAAVATAARRPPVLDTVPASPRSDDHSQGDSSLDLRGLIVIKSPSASDALAGTAAAAEDTPRETDESEWPAGGSSFGTSGSDAGGEDYQEADAAAGAAPTGSVGIRPQQGVDGDRFAWHTEACKPSAGHAVVAASTSTPKVDELGCTFHTPKPSAAAEAIAAAVADSAMEQSVDRSPSRTGADVEAPFPMTAQSFFVPESELVVTRLGESKAAEFRKALSVASGLDPGLRQDLAVLLGDATAGDCGFVGFAGFRGFAAGPGGRGSGIAISEVAVARTQLVATSCGAGLGGRCSSAPETGIAGSSAPLSPPRTGDHPSRPRSGGSHSTSGGQPQASAPTPSIGQRPKPPRQLSLQLPVGTAGDITAHPARPWPQSPRPTSGASEAPASGALPIASSPPWTANLGRPPIGSPPPSAMAVGQQQLARCSETRRAQSAGGGGQQVAAAIETAVSEAASLETKPKTAPTGPEPRHRISEERRGGRSASTGAQPEAAASQRRISEERRARVGVASAAVKAEEAEIAQRTEACRRRSRQVEAQGDALSQLLASSPGGPRVTQ